MGQCEEVGRKALTIIGSEAVLFALFLRARAALSLRVNLPFPLKKHFHICVYISMYLMFEIPCNANISCNALVLILYAGYAL